MKQAPPSPKPDSPPRADIPMVGIGASAGWFEACSELFGQLPAETGAAYVLVAHLDPKHDSQLTPILARHTKMKVEEIRDGTPAERDRLYVIPPNAMLAVERGVFRLTKRETGGLGHMHVIDRFFRSLAEDKGAQAVGVVLSGTLSDGTLGLREIKAAGGLTIAQDPETAKYREMPRNAIASGSVDVVLAPAEIARELARLPNHLQAARDGIPPALRDTAEQQLAELLTVLRNKTGVDFRQYKRTTLLRRLHRRMMTTRRDTLASYLELLKEDRKEARALYEEVLIHVTRFFRDEATFEALREKVLPELVQDRPDRTAIRVWVPGCATGEEAYSLAIAIVEFLHERGLGLPVQVFATDLSEQAIKVAREGIYPETITEDIPKERLVRHFERIDGRYQISKTIRGMCVFAVHDLTADPPFSNMDVVSCRNVLVYMEPDLQRRTLSLIHYALRPNGFLLLGTSESVGRSEDLFEHVDKEHRVWSRRNVAAPAVYQFNPTEQLLRPGRRSEARKASGWSEEDLHREADALLIDQYAPPGVLVNADLEVVQFRGHTGPYLEHAPGRASLNLMNVVRGGLAAELRAAVQEAKTTGNPVHRARLEVATPEGPREVGVQVLPFAGPSSKDRYFLILFLEKEQGRAPAARPAQPPALLASLMGRGRLVEKEARVAALEKDLETTREQLRLIVEDYEATTEELRSANEEAVSSNEELQSTNEELETTKEELQSTNEELTTLNEELQQRNFDVQKVNSDLVNLLNSVGLPIVMLGPDLRIRRFNQKGQELLNLIPTDIGRPFTDIRHPFDPADLKREIVQVLETYRPSELEVEDGEGHRYLLQIHPYRSAEHRIEGVVLVLPSLGRGQSHDT